MRGFTPNEFNARLSKAQILLQKSDLDCLLVTNEADFRYFTGFLTRFWESPTRPWYLLIFANYPPITIVPSIGVHLLKKLGLVKFVRGKARMFQTRVFHYCKIFYLNFSQKMEELAFRQVQKHCCACRSFTSIN